MFWGLAIHSGFHYQQTVLHSYHISKATLEVRIESDEDDDDDKDQIWDTVTPIATSIFTPKAENDNENNNIGDDGEVGSGNTGAVRKKRYSSRVQLWLKHGEQQQHYLLCELDRRRTIQASLDLNVSVGEQITYYLKGVGVVHLIGYMTQIVINDNDNTTANGSNDLNGEYQHRPQSSSSSMPEDLMIESGDYDNNRRLSARMIANDFSFRFFFRIETNRRRSSRRQRRNLRHTRARTENRIRHFGTQTRSSGRTGLARIGAERFGYAGGHFGR